MLLPPPGSAPCAIRANVEMPEASENVFDLNGTWSFALHPTPEDAIASQFFRPDFEATPATTEVKPELTCRSTVPGATEETKAGIDVVPEGSAECVKGVRWADGRWRSIRVPGCWQMQVGSPRLHSVANSSSTCGETLRLA